MSEREHIPYMRMRAHKTVMTTNDISVHSNFSPFYQSDNCKWEQANVKLGLQIVLMQMIAILFHYASVESLSTFQLTEFGHK